MSKIALKSDNITPFDENIIFYNTTDGKVKVALMAKDGQVWMNQNQLAELFDTSIPNINTHISNTLNEG